MPSYQEKRIECSEVNIVVTPFCIACRFCHVEGEFPTMSHDYWQLDTRKEDYKPFVGQRIFIGKPEEPKVTIVGHKCQDCNKDQK